MSRTYSLTSARSLAPAAFRRWVLGGISTAVLGYAIIVMLHVMEHGWSAAVRTTDFAMVLVSLIGLLVAARASEVVGCTMVLLATWIEVESAFITAPNFPPAGLLILPTLFLASGLLLGSRAALGVAVLTLVTTIIVFAVSPTLKASPLRHEAPYWLVIHVLSVLSVWGLHALGMSAYRRVFEAMEANERDLADTIRFAPDGILVARHDGTLVLANPAAEAILRIDHSRIVGQPVADVLTRVSGRPITLDMLRCDSADAPLELVLAPADAPTLHVETSWRRMERDRDQYLLRDVSQRVGAEERRREMELQLSHAQRLDAVGRLAGGLSHDFNNILTAVSGSAEMLRIEKNPKERMALISDIIEARNRGAALTRQLLAFARREVVQPRVIDLSEYVHGVERLLQRVAGDRLRLRFTLEARCFVRVDPGQLEQSLMNLVTNARDALPGGGTCTISVSHATVAARGARVLLRVADDGVGMAPDIVTRAFEPFFTTKARGQGTGLGLAAVHGMAEQSEGQAYITSEPGRGTQVTIELPLVDELPMRSIPETGTPAPRASLHTIVVAEDDAGTRRVVDRILRHAGYDVIAVSDGAEAMALVESPAVTFDLLVSDVMMPGHTGPELADRMHAMRPQTPVLLMTGYAEEQLSELLDDRAGREIITKPFSSEAIASRVAALLRGRRAVQGVQEGGNR